MTGEKPRIELSAVQVVGGALAAASAAVAASLLGVAGTVIGAAVASVVTTVASAMYQHSMRRGKDALERARTAHLTHLNRLPYRKSNPEAVPRPETQEDPEAAAQPAAEAGHEAEGEDDPDASSAGSGWRDRFRALNPKKVAITAACVLVLALGVITGVEALIGRPISSALGRGDNERGTSIGLLAEHRQAPTTGTSPTSGRTSTPTPTGTSTVPRTPTPTATTPTTTTTTTTTRAPLRPTSAPETSRPATTSATSDAPTSAPTTAPARTAPGGDVP